MTRSKQLSVIIFSIFFLNSALSLELQQVHQQEVNILDKNLLENSENLEQNQFILFYNTNRDSQKMETILNQALESLSSMNVIVSKVQIDEQQDEKLLKDLNIEKLPSIKLFRQNKWYDYLGDKNPESFVSWIKRIFQKESYRSIQLNTLEEFNKFYYRNQVFVTFFGKEGSDEFLVYKELTEKYKFTTFSHSFQSEVISNMENTSENFLIVHNRFDRFNKTFEEEWNFSNLKQFVKKYSTKVLTRFNMHILEDLEKNKENVLLLVVNGVQNYKEEIEFRKCRDFFVGKMTIGIIELIKEGGMPFMNRYQLMPNQLPWLGILQNEVDGSQQIKFQLNENEAPNPINITQENIIQFYQDWKDNKLKPYWNSERVPIYNDGPVRKVVQKTWKQFVLDNTKDVVVFAWDSGCQPCYEIRDKYETLGETLTYVDHIRFYDINMVMNEIEGFKPEKLPSIYFFKANDKRPLEMKGHKDLKDTIEFLKENGSFEWPRKSEL